MSKLPAVSAKRLIKFFEDNGHRISRQSGGHIVLRKTGAKYALSIPNHATVSPGVVLQSLRNVGLTRQQLIDSIHQRKQKG